MTASVKPSWRTSRPRVCTAYHHQLAATLEASENAGAEAIAMHFEAAGELERAGLYYGRAGEKAAAALAFNHAASLLRRSLALRPVSGDERADRIAARGGAGERGAQR